MGLDIVKENLCVHKQVGVKKEIIFDKWGSMYI